MSTIHVWFVVHAAGCHGTVYRAGCSEGCEWRQIEAVARFTPEPDASLRDRIMLARMAATFRAREMVS